MRAGTMLELDIFNKSYIDRTPISGVVVPSDLNYLRRLYVFNKDSIQNYYQERNFSVKNTHILSRLLEHFPSYLQYDSYRYLDYASDKTKYLAKHFKFTSDLEKGVVHPSYFFGNEGEEIIISTYDNFDVQKTEKQWKTANPISVLKHNRNDTKLLLPIGNDDGSPTGLDVIAINIPQLSLKYREFIKDQATKTNNEEVIMLTKNNFVIKYVLSSMMEDVIDHVFLNKVIDRFYGREEVIPKYKHRFKIFEPTTQVNRYVDQTLEVITNKRTDYINLLHNIQLMFKLDSAELLGLDGTGSTRNTKWAIVASRIDYMLFLYDVSEKCRDMNRHYLNDWKRLALRMKRDNSLMDMFSYVTAKELEEKLYKVSNF